MTTYFTEIDAWEVKESFPEFYHEVGRFFEIIHKEQPLGFVAIGKINRENCVLGLFIFKEYRNELTKGVVLSILNFPKKLDFKRCFITTVKNSIIKLLKMMKNQGINDLGRIHDEHLFLREF